MRQLPRPGETRAGRAGGSRRVVAVQGELFARTDAERWLVRYAVDCGRWGWRVAGEMALWAWRSWCAPRRERAAQPKAQRRAG